MTATAPLLPELSLDCLTLTETGPADIVRAAAAAGFALVSLWTNPVAAYPRQVVGPEMVETVAELFAETGVRLGQVEAFDLISREQVAGLRPYLALGSVLGARTVQVYNGANPDFRQVADLLRQAVDLAGELGLAVNVEPVSMGRTRTLAAADRLITRAGVDAGIVFDTLHHVRTGGTANDVRAISPGLIRYVQVNDGLLALPTEQWVTEAMAERLYPGEGEFPLTAMLREAPRDVPWGVEAPRRGQLVQGASPARQASDAMQAIVAVIDQLGAAHHLPCLVGTDQQPSDNI